MLVVKFLIALSILFLILLMFGICQAAARGAEQELGMTPKRIDPSYVEKEEGR